MGRIAVLSVPIFKPPEVCETCGGFWFCLGELRNKRCDIIFVIFQPADKLANCQFFNGIDFAMLTDDFFQFGLLTGNNLTSQDTPFGYGQDINPLSFVFPFKMRRDRQAILLLPDGLRARLNAV
jgi:hypothetical protein